MLCIGPRPFPTIAHPSHHRSDPTEPNCLPNAPNLTIYRDKRTSHRRYKSVQIQIGAGSTTAGLFTSSRSLAKLTKSIASNSMAGSTRSTESPTRYTYMDCSLLVLYNLIKSEPPINYSLQTQLLVLRLIDPLKPLVLELAFKCCHLLLNMLCCW